MTGHRSLAADQVPAIEHAVGLVLEDIRRRAPSTPLLILSSLAEGADRLVVRVAVQRFGAAYAAVLPRPPADYRRDFQSPESAAEFDRLLAGARYVAVRGSPVAVDPADAAKTQDAYLQAGSWVSLHSHVLIALWDGQPSRGRGGTADIVGLRLKGRYPGLNDADPLQYAENGTTAHLVARRPDQPATDEGCAVKWCYSDLETRYSENPAAHFNGGLSSIDRVNRLAARHSEAMGASDCVGATAWLHRVCDGLAARFQRRVNRTAILLVVTTLVALFAAALGDWLPPTWVAALRYASLAIGGTASLWSGVARWPGYYVDFRALAEATRIQLAWAAAALPDAVADAYHPVQAMEVSWIRRVVRTAACLDQLRASQLSGANAAEPAPDSSAREWIDGQIDYFLGGHGVLARYRRVRRILSLMGLVCVAAVFLIMGYGKVLELASDLLSNKGWTPTKDSLTVLLSVAGSALAAKAALATFQSVVAIRELESSYATTAHLYTIVRGPFEAAMKNGDAARFGELLRTIGRAALVENTWWLLMRRQRQTRAPRLG